MISNANRCRHGHDTSDSPRTYSDEYSLVATVSYRGMVEVELEYKSLVVYLVQYLHSN